MTIFQRTVVLYFHTAVHTSLVAWPCTWPIVDWKPSNLSQFCNMADSKSLCLAVSFLIWHCFLQTKVEYGGERLQEATSVQSISLWEEWRWENVHFSPPSRRCLQRRYIEVRQFGRRQDQSPSSGQNHQSKKRARQLSTRSQFKIMPPTLLSYNHGQK